MMFYRRLPTVILIFWSGSKAVIDTYGGIEHGIFPLFQYLPFLILILSTLAALVFDLKAYQQIRNRLQLLPSLTGIILCAVVIARLIHYEIIDRSPTVLTVSNLAGANNVLRFEFKENGHFKLVHTELFGHTDYYGRYSRNGDTIRILSSNADDRVGGFSAYAIIQHDTAYWTGADVMIVDRVQTR